ncbi:MAG: RIP metalloprotease RseP, partial [Puniceicoccales bacterium]|nr:RIP metalloprotease RseP [Puniceicoccales bacterium]
MIIDILFSILSSPLGILYFILFFGGSIFVHELGHFLAARKRGLKVERFSIGFGPRLFGWTGKDGVDYRISLLPLGGYVALPQMVDMEAIEGESKSDPDELPQPSYTDKIIVLVAGVVFNLIFAFLIACVLWVTGRPVSPSSRTTTIGHIATELATPGKPSPALVSGLHHGDKILAIDGTPVSDFTQIIGSIALGAGRDSEGNPQVTLRVSRDGKELDLVAKPELLTLNPSSKDQARRIGIGPAEEIIVGKAEPGSPAAIAGLKPGDALLALDDTKLWSFYHLRQLLAANASQATPTQVRLEVRAADGTKRTVALTPMLRPREVDLVKISFKDKTNTVTLPLVPAPDNALQKDPPRLMKFFNVATPPPSSAPRPNLMLFDTTGLPEDSDLAKIIRPGVVLRSIEQAGGFLQIHSIADLLSAAKNVKPGVPTTLVFTDGSDEKQVTLDEFSVQDAPAKRIAFLGIAEQLVPPVLIHQTPFESMGTVFRLTFDSLRALTNRNTDVGANQLMGVVSMAKIYLDADDIRPVLWFTILINISLAIFNILPIPVLDGGHIAIASLQKILGKPLPSNVHSGIHYVFMLLLLLLMGYVLLYDVKRTAPNSLDVQNLIRQRYVAAETFFADEKAKPTPELSPATESAPATVESSSAQTSSPAPQAVTPPPAEPAETESEPASQSRR